MLIKNFATTTISNVLSMAVSALSAILFARWLGAEKQGLYSLAILVPGTVYFLGMCGLATVNIVYAGQYPEKRGAIIFHSLAFAALVGGLFVLCYLYILHLSPFWFQRFTVVGRINLMLASLLVLFELGMNYLRCEVLGEGRILAVNIQTILTPLIKLVLLILFVVVMGLGVRGGILSQLLCFVFTFVIFLFVSGKTVPLRIWKPDLGFFKKSIVFGLKIHLVQVSWYVAHMIDRYMIAYLMPNDNAALGQYTVAAQFSAMIWVLPQSLDTVFLPHLSYTKSDKALITIRTARVLFLVLIPVVLLLTAGSFLIPYIVGKDYTGSIKPFIAFLPALATFGASRPFSSYLLKIEKPMYEVVNTILGAIVNIILNSYFIRAYGITGAAVATCISNTFMAVLCAIFFGYESKLPIGNFLIKREDFILIFNTLKRFYLKLRQSIVS